MLYLGCDHAGLALKQALAQALGQRGVEFEDLGTHTEESVNYVDYAAAVGRSVAQSPANRGILVCGTGIGMAMAANKLPGVRAAVCQEAFSAEMTRRHNDCNLLCLGARIIDEPQALALLDIWLSTPFEGGRHVARVQSMENLANG